MKRAVIVGGFAEGIDLLEPIGHALCEAGLVEDAERFSLRDADEYDQVLKKVADRQLVITHSAGIMAVNNYVQPELTVAFNGPEPRTIAKLILAAVKKSNNHIRTAITGPDRFAHLGILGGNTTEFILSPLWSLKQLKAISRHSTTGQLSVMSQHGLAVRGVACKDDEFFKFDPRQLKANRQVGYQVIDGGHDELLVNPAAVIARTFLAA